MRARARAKAYTVARGRDLMRFYCPNDVTGPLFEPVARRKTVDSIYRVCRTASGPPSFDVFSRPRILKTPAYSRPTPDID